MGNHDAGLRDLIHRRGCHRLGTLQGRSLTRIVMGYLVGHSLFCVEILQLTSEHVVQSRCHV